jgi:uncharacterized protein with GYD domain
MPTYVSLFKWTDQGIRNVKETVARTKANQEAIEKAGGRLIAAYWTQGSYDLVAIAEWPNEEAAMALLLQVGIAGNARSETMRAFSAEEMGRILQKLP